MAGTMNPRPGMILGWIFLLLIGACWVSTTSSAQETVDLKIDLAPFFNGHDAAFVLLDLKQNTYYRLNEAKCRQRFAPCSTFKIPNSLIAFETGIAPDTTFSLKWNGTKHSIAPWNQDQTMKTAFAESCVWFYQEVASRVGTATMNRFVQAMEYGNRDTSGGLTKFWLESSLQISPDEQVDFLKKLCTDQLPFASSSVRLLREIMIATQTADIRVYGKTGTAGDPIKGATMGWYVGFVEKAGDTYVFAVIISGGENPSGRKNRQIVFDVLRAMKLL
jgi:bla regulator protein BlaR1